MLPRHQSRRRLAILGAALCISPVGLAGLEFGSVLVSPPPIGPPVSDTTNWSTNINATAGGGNNVASLSGNMASLTLTTKARISGSPGDTDLSRLNTAQVSFIDEITLDAPIFPAGTDLKVRIAWKVNPGGTGETASTTSGEFIGQSALELSGPGRLVLNDVVFPVLEPWRRFVQDPGAPSLDPFGVVEFEFDIKNNMPEPENVVVDIVSSSTCGFLGSGEPTANWFVNSTTSFVAQFCGITSVRTSGGTEIGTWTVEADSGLDYGEGTVPITLSDPALRIGPSPSGPEFVRLSWQSSPFETYTLQSRDATSGWGTEETIPGEDAIITRDLMQSGAVRLYKLLSDFTTP